MTNLSREVLEKFEIRKSKREKAAFRAWLQQKLTDMGYAPTVEQHKGLYTSHNVVAGDPDKAKVLLTAHYDTCAVLPFPNFITPRNFFWYLVYQLLIVVVFFAMVFVVGVCVTLPAAFLLEHGNWGAILNLGPDFVEPDPDVVITVISFVTSYAMLIFGLWWMFDGKANRHTANDNTSGVVMLLEIAQALPEELRKDVCFVWFDNEERGLLGSGAFAKKHKAAKKNALVLNFDCVGDGDSLQFFPSKKVKKDGTPDLLRRSFLAAGEKTVEVVEGFGFYPSDQAAFAHGVGICALKKSKLFGWYMDRIHTKRDTVLDEGNIDLLRAGTVRLVQTLREKEETHA